MSKFFVSTLIIMGVIATPATCIADTSAPEISMEGLELVDKTRRGELYADPEIDWSIYEQIELEPATVAFRKNWQRDQNRNYPTRIRASDMERIQSDLSDLFGTVFTEELSNGGYAMTDGSGEAVMRIIPRIVDLDVYAPDTRNIGVQKSFTESAGRMTLKLEIYDSVTGDLIATASDRRESPRRGYLQWTTSVTNNAEARRMLQRWAVSLVERLDEARTTTRMN